MRKHQRKKTTPRTPFPITVHPGLMTPTTVQTSVPSPPLHLRKPLCYIATVTVGGSVPQQPCEANYEYEVQYTQYRTTLSPLHDFSPDLQISCTVFGLDKVVIISLDPHQLSCLPQLRCEFVNNVSSLFRVIGVHHCKKFTCRCVLHKVISSGTCVN